MTSIKSKKKKIPSLKYKTKSHQSKVKILKNIKFHQLKVSFENSLR